MNKKQTPIDYLSDHDQLVAILREISFVLKIIMILIILMLVMNNQSLQRLLEIIGKKESDFFGIEKLQPERMLQVKPLLIELLLQKQSEKLLMIEL